MNQGGTKGGATATDSTDFGSVGVLRMNLKVPESRMFGSVGLARPTRLRFLWEVQSGNRIKQAGL